MEPENVKERLLRLNSEIHDVRFKSHDLTLPLRAWNLAKKEYESSNYDAAEAHIDEAYRILYNTGYEQPVQPPPIAIPMYVEYEEKDTTHRALDSACDFMKTALLASVRPRAVFASLQTSKPADQTVFSYMLFALAATATLMVCLSGIWGHANFLTAASVLFVGLMVLCFACAGIEHKVAKICGGKSQFIRSFSVFGLSLTPMTIWAIIMAYLGYGKNPWRILLGLFLGLVFFSWSTYLQKVGVEVIHGLDWKKALTAVLSALAVFAVGVVCIVIILVGTTIYSSLGL